jgi:hypothetical protein
MKLCQVPGTHLAVAAAPVHINVDKQAEELAFGHGKIGTSS